MRYEPKVYRSEQYNCQMNELMFQAGVKGMSERSELIPCTSIIFLSPVVWVHMHAGGPPKLRHCETHVFRLVEPRLTQMRYS